MYMTINQYPEYIKTLKTQQKENTKPIFETDTFLNRCLPKENIWMVNKHKKGFSSVDIREV